jgi:hypothetical protein
MAKKDEPIRMWETYNVKTGEYRAGVSGGGAGFCLLNTLLLLAAPTALVGLVVKRVRR